MIDFEKELEKFKPSLEISQIAEKLIKDDKNDISDIITEIVRKETIR